MKSIKVILLVLALEVMLMTSHWLFGLWNTLTLTFLLAVMVGIVTWVNGGDLDDKYSQRIFTS